MPAIDPHSLAHALYPAMLEAGRLEMQHFKSGVAIETKADKSPVTIADRDAEAILLVALAKVAPGIAVVAEEAVAAGHVPAPAAVFVLVDALDGTRLFIRGKPEFSVNIGLIDHGKPAFGMIYIPPTGDLFFTRGANVAYRAHAPCAVDQHIAFADLQLVRLQTREPDLAHLKAFNSRSAGAVGAGLLETLQVKDAEPIGSSLKFCLIAAGEGDLYARLGETSEWDTAAGQAILEAAGGSVTVNGGAPLHYGKADAKYCNPHFVAWARSPLLNDFSGR
jgi:3'(2'), 5'-bisphosphate nucleotidase